MKKQERKNISENLVFQKTNLIDGLRRNIEAYMKENDLTIREMSEMADIPFESFKGILYNTQRADCNLSTVVKISLATGLPMDVLVGAGTIDPLTAESMSICRSLPEHSLYLVRYFIRHQKKIYENNTSSKPPISMLRPPCVGGRLLTTNDYVELDISHLPEWVQNSVFLGIKIPCEHYMPYYAPGEILLVSADREALNGERCVVTHQGKIFIVTKQSYIEKGVKKWKYVALKNDKIEMPEAAIDDKVGYIVAFLNPDKSMGRR